MKIGSTSSRAWNANYVESRTTYAPNPYSVYANWIQSIASLYVGYQLDMRGKRRHDASEMLAPRTRRCEASSGGKKVSPWHTRYLVSVCFPTLSHGVVCHLEGEIPTTWTRWPSLGTAQMACHTAKEATRSSVTGGSPPVGSSPLKANSLLSAE